VSTPAFLNGVSFRPVSLAANSPFKPVGLALGQGSQGLEVVVATSEKPPRLPNVRTAWKERNNHRATPLLFVVLHQGTVTLCGPAGDDPPAYPNIDPGQAERICREALNQPDRHAAQRYLRDALPAIIESKLPGLRNEGFLATHTLAAGARKLETWADAEGKARRVLKTQGEELLRALGFKIDRGDNVTSILSHTDPRYGLGLSVAAVLGRGPGRGGDS
jgi:hypothetical protein